MANKYIIHGATYCGDGTSSALATSAGAAGAWNDINVLEGTSPAYGALAAGDVVYIRSKTSAGADITRTLAANVTLGSSAATAAAWVTWVIDGGTIWSGINGTLTYTMASSYTVTQMAYNDIQADIPDRFALVLPTMRIVDAIVHNTAAGAGATFDFGYLTGSYGVTTGAARTCGAEFISAGDMNATTVKRLTKSVTAEPVAAVGNLTDDAVGWGLKVTGAGYAAGTVIRATLYVATI